MADRTDPFGRRNRHTAGQRSSLWAGNLEVIEKKEILALRAERVGGATMVVFTPPTEVIVPSLAHTGEA